MGLFDLPEISEKPKRKGKRIKVSVPYAPTPKGKAAERRARGKTTVPYAPTPTGKAAEKKAERKAKRKRARKVARRIRDFKPIDIGEVGTKEKDSVLDALKESYDRQPLAPVIDDALKTAKDEGKNLYEVAKENYAHPERLGDLPTGKELKAAAAIAALTPTGRAASTAERALAEAASNASTVRSAAKLVEKGASKVKDAPVRTASKVGVKARGGSKRLEETTIKPRSVPRLKGTPKRAKRAATTKQGRRAAAKGAGRKARRHPVRTGYGAAAVSPVPLPGDADQRARAFAEGTAAAVLNHPGKVAETTAHGVLGFLTAPLAVGGAAVESAKQGSAAPLEQEVGGLIYSPASEDKEHHLEGGAIGMLKNLASGDANTVEQTTLHQTGFTPFIPAPHILRRLKRTKAYEDGVRGKLRSKVETKRAKTRAKRIKSETTAKQAGEFVPRKKAKKIRQSVADSARPGENYALRRTGRFIEKQRSRHHVSREVARIQEEGSFAAKKNSEAVAKPLRKSKGTNQKEQNYGEALRIVVKHGLPADEAAGMAFVKRLNDNWPKVKPDEIPAGVHLDRHSTQFILEHPEIFKDKHFWESVKQFDRQAAEVGTSSRNQYLAQVDNIINPILKEQGKPRILKPEEMVTPEAASLLRGAVPRRTDQWTRGEALSYARDLAEVKGKSRAKALAIRKELLASMEDLMRPPEHGGAEGGVSTTRAVAWTPAQEAAFVRRAQEEGQALGLRDPAAYVADRLPSALKGSEVAPDFAVGLPLRKVWPSQGKAARSGNAESSFESLIGPSIEAPRTRGALVKGLNRIFDKASRQVAGKRYLNSREVERAINSHQVPDGTIFVRTQALKSILEGEIHVSPEEFTRRLEGEIEHGQKLASSSASELRAEIETAKASGAKGEKYAPMDAAAIHELMGHMEPLGRLTRYAAHSTNFVTRTILNSPAFAAIQIPQEGLPLAAALGRNVVHVPKAIANLKEIAKLPIADQASIKAVVGSSVGVLGAPSTKALRSEGFMNPVRAAGSTPAWRKVWNVVNGNLIGRFDRSRAGRFREVAGMAKIEGDLKRASKGFNAWRHSANNLFKHEQAAVKAMQGMTPAERMAYVAEHPRLGDEFMKDLNGMAGNWNSFTVFEKQFAPLTLFYPFQRYSVLWMLYHFPLDHPVVATALTTLGQINAQELQKIAATKGATPGILDYTLPVIPHGEGQEPSVLPAGIRTFPGLATLQQSLVTGKPSQLVGELPPILSIPVEAATGKSSYTGQDIGENGWSYIARQVGNLSPFLRFIGAPDVGADPSTAAQTFGAQDPLKKYRTIDPFIGQSASQFAETKKLEKGFDTKYGEGDIPGPFDSKLVQDLLYGNNGKPKPKMLPEVLKAIHESERASKYIKGQENRFLPPSGDFTETQKKLLQAVEDAWQTGPNADPEEGGSKYAGSNKYSSGNKYLEGNKYLQANKYAGG
jgi:hypothetical protein